MYCRCNPKKKKPSRSKPWFQDLLAGEFYRGCDTTGRGVGVAYLGAGFYVTWDLGVAEAFAALAVDQTKKRPAKLLTYRLRPGLKLLDNHSKTMIKIKRELGVEPWDKIDSPIFANLLTFHAKNAGYDGIIDSDPYMGLVLFDAAAAIKIGENVLGGGQNSLGLTYDRWYFAATSGVPKGRKPEKLDPKLRAAWQNDEDPTDWRRHFLGAIDPCVNLLMK